MTKLTKAQFDIVRRMAEPSAVLAIATGSKVAGVVRPDAREGSGGTRMTCRVSLGDAVALRQAGAIVCTRDTGESLTYTITETGLALLRGWVKTAARRRKSLEDA